MFFRLGSLLALYWLSSSTRQTDRQRNARPKPRTTVRIVTEHHGELWLKDRQAGRQAGR